MPSTVHHGRVWWPQRAAVLVLAALVTATAATPVDETAKEDTSPWRFRLAPYAWLTSTSGSIGAGPLSTDAGMDSSTILSNLQIGAMFIAEVAYDRWSLENDLIYARFQSSKATPGTNFGDLQGTLYELFWTSYLGYRVIQTDRFTMDLQAGFRLVSMGLELELTPGTSPGLSRYYDRTWIDPVVGLRTRTYLNDWLFVPLRGDVGGFGANSQFTWQAFAGVGIQISQGAALIAGYRTLGYNYDQANFEYNVNTHGPLLGFEISF
jgi:opacity protein-like surface antigen